MDVSDPYADPLVFGQRLQILRTRKGLTRDQLGGLVGRSGSWVKGVETGRLKTPKLDTILALAEALRVRDLSDLTGDQSLHVDLFVGPGHPRLAAAWREEVAAAAWQGQVIGQVLGYREGYSDGYLDGIALPGIVPAASVLSRSGSAVSGCGSAETAVTSSYSTMPICVWAMFSSDEAFRQPRHCVGEQSVAALERVWAVARHVQHWIARRGAVGVLVGDDA